MRGTLGYPFLTTAAAEGETRFEPLLRSSLAHRHRALDARFEQRDGWLVATSYPRERERVTAGVVDVSHIGKLEVFSDGEPQDEAICASLRVGPGRFVLVCRYAELLGLARRLSAASTFVIDRTSAWCALLLAGADRDALLRRVSPIETVPGRGPFGRVPASILDRPSGYWALFSQEFAQYGWDLAVDAAVPLGGGPVGAEAVASDEPLLAVASAARV